MKYWKPLRRNSEMFPWIDWIEQQDFSWGLLMKQYLGGDFWQFTSAWKSLDFHRIYSRAQASPQSTVMIVRRNSYTSLHRRKLLGGKPLSASMSSSRDSERRLLMIPIFSLKNSLGKFIYDFSLTILQHIKVISVYICLERCIYCLFYIPMSISVYLYKYIEMSVCLYVYLSHRFHRH